MVIAWSAPMSASMNGSNRGFDLSPQTLSQSMFFAGATAGAFLVKQTLLVT